MDTLTSAFTTKKVAVPMTVWQFDETQVIPLPDNKHFFTLPAEVEQEFADAGYTVLIVNAQQWALDGDNDFVYAGQAIEATVTFRNNTHHQVTVTHGQHVAFKPTGEVSIIAPEDILS